MASSYYSGFPRLKNQRDVVMMYSIKKHFIYATNMAAGFASQASMFLQVENKIKDIRRKVRERILVIQQKGVSELNQICAPLGIQVSKDSGYNEIEKAVLNKMQEVFKKNGETITKEIEDRFETFRSLKEINRFKSGQKLFNMSESTKTLKPLIKSLEAAYREGKITADDLKSQLRVALQNAIDVGVNKYLDDSLRKIIETNSRNKHDGNVASFSEQAVDDLIDRIVNDKRGVVSIMNKFNNNMQNLFSNYFKVFTSKTDGFYKEYAEDVEKTFNESIESNTNKIDQNSINQLKNKFTQIMTEFDSSSKKSIALTMGDLCEPVFALLFQNLPGIENIRYAGLEDVKKRITNDLGLTLGGREYGVTIKSGVGTIMGLNMESSFSDPKINYAHIIDKEITDTLTSDEIVWKYLFANTFSLRADGGLQGSRYDFIGRLRGQLGIIAAINFVLGKLYSAASIDVGGTSYKDNQAIVELINNNITFPLFFATPLGITTTLKVLQNVIEQWLGPQSEWNRNPMDRGWYTDDKGVIHDAKLEAKTSELKNYWYTYGLISGDRSGVENQKFTKEESAKHLNKAFELMESISKDLTVDKMKTLLNSNMNIYFNSRKFFLGEGK